MEQREFSVEEIVHATQAYEKEVAGQNKRCLLKTVIFSIGILAIFVYLRFFNTSFELMKYDEHTVGVSVEYSTAWVVRYPSYYDGYRITNVKVNNNLGPNTKYVYLEDGIEEIDSQAFFSADMEYIRLPETLSCIYAYAFANCRSLKEIFWEKSTNNTTIQEFAFANTTLKHLVLPEGVTEIREMVFAHSANLETVVLPDSLSKIDTGAFFECTNLKTVTLPESLDIIPDFMFSNCTVLENINLHNNLAAIGKYAFYETPINEEQFPDNLYYASYMNVSDYECYEQSGRYEWDLISDMLYNFREPDGIDEFVTTIFDKEMAWKYYSQRTGIPLEVFQEPITSQRIWIEGKYYEFPMLYEDFLKIDNWILHEETNAYSDEVYRYYEHVDSGRTLKLLQYTDEKNCNMVEGVEVTRRLEHICNIVLPGGILMTNDDLHYYYTVNTIGTKGNEQHPYEYYVDFYSRRSNRIVGMAVYMKDLEEIEIE